MRWISTFCMTRSFVYYLFGCHDGFRCAKRGKGAAGGGEESSLSCLELSGYLTEGTITGLGAGEKHTPLCKHTLGLTRIKGFLGSTLVKRNVTKY